MLLQKSYVQESYVQIESRSIERQVYDWSRTGPELVQIVREQPT